MTLASSANPVLLVLDAGTSNFRAALFGADGHLLKLHRRAITTHRPAPGHAEMDPKDILHAADQVLGRALADCRAHGWTPAALGLSVQRSSFLLWNVAESAPASPILSWQDTRAEDVLDRFRSDSADIAAITGLPLSPHYGGPKLAHLMAQSPGIVSDLQAGRLKFIPLSTLLCHHFTGSLFIDETIAGRTLVFDIRRRKWDTGLLETFGWPEAALPEVVPAAHDYGTMHLAGFKVPLHLCLGDQQAAMTGLGATATGELAINYGTSGSVMLHTGSVPRPTEGLLANLAWSTSESADYLLEGTVNAVGALFRWFADIEGDVENDVDLARDWPRLAATATDLVMVPGINGLAAPYWRPDVETTFVPDAKNARLEDRLGAGIASIAHLTTDIVERMQAAGIGHPEHFECATLPQHRPVEGDRPKHVEGFGDIHCGGGMARPALLQLQADLLGQPLYRHRLREATARGVALRLAEMLGWDKLTTAGSKRRFVPQMDTTARSAARNRWQTAIEQVLG